MDIQKDTWTNFIKTITLVTGLFVLQSCNDQTTQNTVVYKDGKQVPVLDTTQTDIGILAVDSVFVGQEYCAKIWLTNKNQKTLKSYVDGDFNKSLVDTINQTLDNCRMKLLVENDTTIFCLTPGDGAKAFIYKIAILTSDSKNIYHLKTVNLKFKSVDNNE